MPQEEVRESACSVHLHKALQKLLVLPRKSVSISWS